MRPLHLAEMPSRLTTAYVTYSNTHHGSDWWNSPPGCELLAEVRRRAVRNAAHIAAGADIGPSRDLVDDVVTAAWMVLHRHNDKVLKAARPWAYLMHSAQRDALAEVRAQQLLTKPACIRGRAREVLPQTVRAIGATSSDLATAFRHEHQGASEDATDPRITRQVRHHVTPPLLEPNSAPEAADRQREPWYTAFIDLLVNHGANRATVAAAVDRLADLFSTTSAGRWECAARRDPILNRLGLAPDQCGALVALLAGSRQHRHNGRTDSLIHAVRSSARRGANMELSANQRGRIATFVEQTIADNPVGTP